MLACENPKCPFHKFDCDPAMLQAGWLHFRPLEVIQAHPIPAGTTGYVRSGEIKVVPYTHVHGGVFYLCEVCDSAASMFRR